MLGSSSSLGPHSSSHEHAMLPVPRLDHQRDALGTTPSEQDGGDGHTFRALPLVVYDRALFSWGAESVKYNIQVSKYSNLSISIIR